MSAAEINQRTGERRDRADHLYAAVLLGIAVGILPPGVGWALRLGVKGS